MTKITEPRPAQLDYALTEYTAHFQKGTREIQNEYDELLVKKNRTQDDERRIAEIEHYLFQQMINRELSE